MDVFDFKDGDELNFSPPTKMKTPVCVANGEYCSEKTASLNSNLLLNLSGREHRHFLPSEVSPDSLCKRLEQRLLHAEASTQMDDRLNCSFPESKSSDEADDVFADAYESPNVGSPSTSSYVSGDDVALEEGHELSADSRFDIMQQLGDRNVVLVCPDYIVYQGRYSTESLLIFSKESVKLKDSATHGDQGMSTFEWEIADIVDIQSQWSSRLEVAMIKLHVLFKGAGDFSEVEEMQFAVVDVNWPEKQEKIMSLDVRYKAAWNVVADTETEISRTSGESIWRNSYFPDFAEFSDEVIYPKGDPDAVSISKRDVGLLQPDIFVNDTIIDFYIKYLKNQMPSESRNRFHFFNSFFFRKLIDLDKDPPSSFEGKAAFQRVRKWTRKVNLFEKDYVFIPVNYSYHWSLVVICHPGEITKIQDEAMEKLLKVPCILHMDSLKGSHTVLKHIVQSYLWEEWKEKNKDTSEDISPKFFDLRFISLELPQQPNAYDCGLFLLHYVELFLEEAPMKFSLSNITRFSRFLNPDWFPPEEPCLKRAYIQQLIYSILKGEKSAAACGSKLCASDYSANNYASERILKSNSKKCSPSKSVHGNLSGSQSSEGIEITLLHMSSSQHDGAPSLVLREFMGVGDTAEPFLDNQCQTFDQAAAFGVIGHMKDDIEACAEFVYTRSNMNPDSVLPYLSSGLEADTHKGDHSDFEEHRETSDAGSGYSSEVEIQENKPFENTLQIEEKIIAPKSPSAEKPLSDHILSSHGDVQDSENATCSKPDLDVAPETLASEVDEKQRSEIVSEILVSETVSEILVSETISGIPVLETDGTLDSETIGKAETGERQGSDTVSEVLVPETDGKLDLDNDLVSELGMKVVAKRISDDLLPESDELQPAKRPRLDSSPNGEDESAL